MGHDDPFVLTNEEEDMLVGTGQPGRDRRMDTMNGCPWTTDECRMVPSVHDTDAEATMGGFGTVSLGATRFDRHRFYGGWGPCGPATIEGMLLMSVGILGVLGGGSLLVGKTLLGLARDVLPA